MGSDVKKKKTPNFWDALFPWIPFVAPLRLLFLDENESVDPKEKNTEIACLPYSRALTATFMQKGGLLKH